MLTVSLYCGKKLLTTQPVVGANDFPIKTKNTHQLEIHMLFKSYSHDQGLVRDIKIN